MKRFTAFAFAVIMCISLAFVAADAYICTPADDVTVAKKMVSKKTVAKNGTVIEYDMYNSPSFNPADDSKESTVILCFAENGKQRSELVSLLVSEMADKQYSKYYYTVVNVRVPADQKWVDTDEEHGSYDVAETPVTPAMEAMPEVILDIKAVGFPARKIIVAGIGSGGTAAWDFALRNPAEVSHLITVGASVDTESFEGLIANDVKAFAYVGTADASRAQAHKVMQSNARSAGYGSLVVETVGGDFNECLSTVMTKKDDPSVTDWIIEQSYQTRFFTVRSSVIGEGSITPTQQAYYGTSKVFNITVKKGYTVTGLAIDGKATPITELKNPVTAENGELSYTYTFTNITSERSITVTVKKASSAMLGGSSLLTVSLSVCLLAAAAAALVFFFCKQKEEKR